MGLQPVPAITLTGLPGTAVRVENIPQFGPTGAWATLQTVTLTSSTQVYFDTNAPGQPRRVYRLLSLP